MTNKPKTVYGTVDVGQRGGLQSALNIGHPKAKIHRKQDETFARDAPHTSKIEEGPAVNAV